MRGFLFSLILFSSLTNCFCDTNTPSLSLKYLDMGPSPLDPLRILEDITRAPSHWGLEIIGADLAKKEVKDMKLKPVNLVISDGGISSSQAKVSFPTSRPKETYALLQSVREKAEIRTSADWISLAKETIELVQNELERITSNVVRLLHENDPYHGDYVAAVAGYEQSSIGVSNLVEIEDLPVLKDSFYAFRNIISGYKTLAERKEPTAVLNISHSLSAIPQVAESLRQVVKAKDTLCVIASHNFHAELHPLFVVSQMDECIVVGSLGVSGIRSDFSNYGKALKLIAPGDYILSFRHPEDAKNKEIVEAVSGTSFSAPMVSGVGGNLRALLPFATYQQIQTLLYKTAIDIGLTGKDDSTGYGIINALRATKIAKRLLESGIQSSAALADALKDENAFNLEVFSKDALEKSKTFKEGSSEQLQALREAVLLDGHAESFVELGRAYEKTKFKDYALGLKMIGLNRSKIKIPRDDLIQMANHLAKLQVVALSENPPNYYVIQSIANLELLAEISARLPRHTALMTNPTFAKQSKLIAQSVVPTNWSPQILSDSSWTARAATPEKE